ncbi:hypothetical protein J2S46_000536 [Kitasatospora herbaricolor]|nr:hypothetical protein [Kitasatospora herbaricolor]
MIHDPPPTEARAGTVDDRAQRGQVGFTVTQGTAWRGSGDGTDGELRGLVRSEMFSAPPYWHDRGCGGSEECLPPAATLTDQRVAVRWEKTTVFER